MHDAIYAPESLPWNLRIHPWKGKSSPTIFRLYVDLLGCNIVVTEFQIFFSKKNCGKGGGIVHHYFGWFTGGYSWIDIGTSKRYPYAPCMEYCSAFRINKNAIHGSANMKKSSHGILWELYLHHSREFLKTQPWKSLPPFFLNGGSFWKMINPY